MLQAVSHFILPSLTVTMHCSSVQSTATYEHHSGFPLWTCHQLYHCNPFMNFFPPSIIGRKESTLSYISGHGGYTCYAVSMSHIRVQVYCLVWSRSKPSSITKLEIQCSTKEPGLIMYKSFAFYKCNCNNLYRWRCRIWLWKDELLAPVPIFKNMFYVFFSLSFCFKNSGFFNFHISLHHLNLCFFINLKCFGIKAYLFMCCHWSKTFLHTGRFRM
jgi:hypothetical protein